MPRRPPLSLVASGVTCDEPPRQLGRHGIELWRAVTAEYRIEDRGGRELLMQACTALDRAEDLAAEIARDGVVLRSKRSGTARSHPACKDELACRTFIARTIERLGLNVEAIKPAAGRPVQPSGWTGDTGDEP